MNLQGPIHIAGAGPTGALLALLLQRRGAGEVLLYDARPESLEAATPAGRSINLALSARGIAALQYAGVFEHIEPAMLPMRGRLMHALDGTTTFQPYGARPDEINYSVARHFLSQTLVRLAAARPGVTVHFEHRLQSLDVARSTATVRDVRRDRLVEIAMQPLIGADGAASAVRRALAATRCIESEEVDLRHGYKELTIPADARGGHRLAREALHIWPRGEHMLIALPNTDGSFTATLFMPKEGAISFAALSAQGAVDRFLAAHYADAYALMPQAAHDFARNPVGFIGTVHAMPWHAGGSVMLIGDAAHALVPFHGQGMNCCFEDCRIFDGIIADAPSWQHAFAEFGRVRKPDTDAIAAMSQENYLEMRERVADPRFLLQQSLALELQTRHPERFIPRYSMVTFHPEIPYRIALQQSAIQDAILRDLTAGISSLAQVDYERAAREVQARLPPLSRMGSLVPGL